MVMESLHNILTTSPMVSALAALFLAFYFLLRWRAKPNYGTKGSRREAPELPGGWPILGHLPMLSAGRAGVSDSKLLHKALGAMADKYGPVFSIRIGVHKCFVVTSAETMKECFTTNDKVWPNRPQGVAGSIIGHDYVNFAFADYGPYWIQLRKIIISELLSNRRMDLLKRVWHSEVDTSMKDLYQSCINPDAKASGPVVVEMKKWFGDLTLNMMLRMIAGRRYSTATSASDAKELLRWRVAMRDFMRLLSTFLVQDAIPYLKWFDEGAKKEMRSTINELDSLFQGWLDDHRKKRSSGEVPEEQDFIYVMMTALENAKIFDQDHDTIVKTSCLSIISGGADTLMLSLTWIICLLLNNRKELKKVQDELDHHVGRNRLVNETDIKNLTYLHVVIKEALRLYPGVPLSGMRVASQDTTIAGYHVPKGSRLLVNIWKMHRNPAVWSNPSEFCPERFLTAHADMDIKGQDFDLLPFSSGRRMCPGIGFALPVMPFVTARLLQGFDISTPMDMPVDMTETGGTTNSKATPLEVIITPRLSPELY